MFPVAVLEAALLEEAVLLEEVFPVPGWGNAAAFSSEGAALLEEVFAAVPGEVVAGAEGVCPAGAGGEADGCGEGAIVGVVVAVGSGVNSAFGAAVASAAGMAELPFAVEVLAVELREFAVEPLSSDAGRNAKNKPAAASAIITAPVTRVAVLSFVPLRRAIKKSPTFGARAPVTQTKCPVEDGEAP